MELRMKEMQMMVRERMVAMRKRMSLEILEYSRFSKLMLDGFSVSLRWMRRLKMRKGEQQLKVLQQVFLR
jgi:hypothetical protein